MLLLTGLLLQAPPPDTLTAEAQRPLALAVIGGLAVSTAVTLLVLPTMLDLLGALQHFE